MNETLYEVKETTQFKKDYRLAKKRGQNLQLLKAASINPLSEDFRAKFSFRKG